MQPWHPSSTLVHEAALAVLKLWPDQFWPFSKALFAAQTEYFDVSVVNETRNQTYKRLAELAGKVSGLGPAGAAEVYKLLEISDKPGPGGERNAGNQVTDDLKQVIKAARVVGVHVSPTVFYNVSSLTSAIT